MRESRTAWTSFTAAILFSLCLGCGDGNDNTADHPEVTPTPSSSATPAPRVCPTRLDLRIDGAGTDIDLGATGIAYDVPLNEGIALPLAVACDGADDDCDRCVLTATSAATGERPRRRCANDSRTTCSTDGDCASGSCIDFFGPPFGVTTGGAASCTRNRLVSVGPGSYTPASGAIELPLVLRWTFFTNPDPGNPCPHCTGADLGDPGVCEGGSHDGESCVVDGTDPLFGTTSYDCPPHRGGELGSFELAMTLTTNTSRLEPDATCTADPFRGLPCYCEGQTIANACADRACGPGSGDDRVCSAGPRDGLCAQERFRGCRDDGDCPADGDHCDIRPRECLGESTESGVVSPIERTGIADPARPVLTATFCVPAASSAGPNQALGLPGQTTFRLPVRIESTP